MRHMNQEAAKTIKYGGLSEDEALALITINPAGSSAWTSGWVPSSRARTPTW
jgi:imidazolonepropionase-like amidohydrolase